MKRKIATAILAGALAQLALADSTVQQAQEELKAQGYYFGQIDGDKNADTIAAIRRFQIRNGLQVTGELNEETLRALHADSASSTAATTPSFRNGGRRASISSARTSLAFIARYGRRC